MEDLNITDREPIHKNRRKIKIVSQNANEILADIEMADDASVEGTPITAQLFEDFKTNVTSACTALAREAKATADDALDRAVKGLGTKVIENGDTLLTFDADTKVNVADIVDSLTTESTTAPLSANQGRQLKSYIDNIWDKIYPVGAIYISILKTSPGLLFGGEWEMLPSGKALWIRPETEEPQKDENGQYIVETLPETLPNITGYLDCTPGSDTDHSTNTVWHGAVQGRNCSRKNSDNTTNTNGSAFSGFNFDASKSNSIYGNGNTVRPPSIKVYAWRRKS